MDNRKYDDQRLLNLINDWHKDHEQDEISRIASVIHKFHSENEKSFIYFPKDREFTKFTEFERNYLSEICEREVIKHIKKKFVHFFIGLSTLLLITGTLIIQYARVTIEGSFNEEKNELIDKINEEVRTAQTEGIFHIRNKFDTESDELSDELRNKFEAESKKLSEILRNKFHVESKELNEMLRKQIITVAKEAYKLSKGELETSSQEINEPVDPTTELQ